MKSTISAFVTGLIFGLGLILAEMVNPARVRGFLDVAGSWDPTLLFVMGGALLVAAVGYKFIFLRGHPLFATTFAVPTRREIDSRLLVGAALFGVGWGMSGLCPGPAIVGLATLDADIVIFMVAMMGGMKLLDYIEKQ